MTEVIAPVRAPEVAREEDFIAAVLADPTLYEQVAFVTPAMFTQPAFRELWRAIQANDGKVAPAVLYADVVATHEGAEALATIDPSPSPETIQRLATAGLIAGDAQVLAERIAADYVRREVRRIFVEEQRLDDPDVGSWVRRLADRIAATGTVLTPSITSGVLARGARAVAEDVIWRQANPGKVRGIRTNFGAHSGKLGRFDRVTDGLHPGELTLICGQTGGGKTMMLCAMALSAALTPRDTTGEPNRVAFFSLEMSERALAKRWVANLTELPLDAAVLPDNAIERIDAAIERLTSLERERRLLIVPPSEATTVEQIVQHLRRMQRDGGIDLAFIDYAQIIRTSAYGNTVSRYDQLAYISMLLKIEAEQLGIPIVMAAQLTRPDRETGWRPSLADIADSYALARNADNIHHIWFPADMLAGDRVGLWRDIAVVLTDKLRNRERPGPLYYHAQRGFARFVECPPHVVAQLEDDEQQRILSERVRRTGTR